MFSNKLAPLGAALALVAVAAHGPASAQGAAKPAEKKAAALPKLDIARMTFFITSVNPGNGANLGGLSGADAYCAKLAKEAGSKRTEWRAYLSTTPIIDRSVTPMKVTPAVNAADRIGNGPWRNARGVVIAPNVKALHAGSPKISRTVALDEKGEPVNGRTEKPNRHDILTGSDTLGRHSTAGGDTTCGNWTKSGDGSAIVGHHDRAGLYKAWNMVSWNSSHGTVGCSLEQLAKTGGAGLYYCFAQK